MDEYCVNTNRQTNGDHEVHNLGRATSCLPDHANRLPLGQHEDCRSAVAQAKELGYSTANGCAYCAPACHTG